MGFFEKQCRNQEAVRAEWKNRKAAEREELGDDREEAVFAVTSDKTLFGNFLDTLAVNPELSAGNLALAVWHYDREVEKPGFLATAEKWKSLGAKVTDRDKGVKVFVPRKYEIDGETRTAFDVGRLYGAEATDAKSDPPRNAFREKADFLKAGDALFASCRARFEETEGDSFYDPNQNTVYLSENAPTGAAFFDLVKGITLYRLHHEHRDEEFFDLGEHMPTADAVAYTVCRRFGVNVPFDGFPIRETFSGLDNGDERLSVLRSIAKHAERAGDRVDYEVFPPEKNVEREADAPEKDASKNREYEPSF